MSRRQNRRRKQRRKARNQAEESARLSTRHPPRKRWQGSVTFLLNRRDPGVQWHVTWSGVRIPLDATTQIAGVAEVALTQLALRGGEVN